MAYKSFIKISPSVRKAGVGFLPVLDQTPPPQNFISVQDSPPNSRFSGIDSSEYLAGDVVEVTESANYNGQHTIADIEDATSMVLDVAFIAGDDGLITFISRP